jgi:hypothetical protein
VLSLILLFRLLHECVLDLPLLVLCSGHVLAHLVRLLQDVVDEGVELLVRHVERFVRRGEFTRVAGVEEFEDVAFFRDRVEEEFVVSHVPELRLALVFASRVRGENGALCLLEGEVADQPSV